MLSILEDIKNTEEKLKGLYQVRNEMILEMYQKGRRARELCAKFGLHRSTFWRILKEESKNQGVELRTPDRN
jgi:DNA invertase Pin-like site-specific DNA recombinase